MDELKVIARFRIHEGQADRFMELADSCLEAVREQDQGTLQYDWFFDQARTECVVMERYRDSDAVLEHIAHVGAALPELAQIADLSITICGSPSEALIAASAGLETEVLGFYQGI